MRSLIFLLLLSFNATAALYPRDLDGDITNGHEGVYDNVLDITWLAKPCSQNNILEALNMDGQGCRFITGNPISEWDYIHSELLPRLNKHDGDGFWGISNWRLATISPASVNSINAYDQFTFNTNCGHLNACFNYSHNGSGDLGYNIERTSNELGYHYYANFGAFAGHQNGGIQNAKNQEVIDLFDLDFVSSTYYGSFNINTVYFLMNKLHWNGPYCGGNSSSDPCFRGVYFRFEDGATTQQNGTNFGAIWLVFDGDVSPANGIGETAAAVTPDGSAYGQLLYGNIASLTDGDYYEIDQIPSKGFALIDQESGQWIYKTSSAVEDNDSFVVKVTADDGTTYHQTIKVAITARAASKNVPAMGGIGLLALGLSMLGLGAIRMRKK